MLILQILHYMISNKLDILRNLKKYYHICNTSNYIIKNKDFIIRNDKEFQILESGLYLIIVSFHCYNNKVINLMVNDTLVTTSDSDDYEMLTLNALCQIKANDRIHLTPFTNDGNYFNFTIIEI